jgi:hypothetical protein
MSISGVSSQSNLSQTDSASSIYQLRQSFKQLATSLQSGDLSGAQKAFSALESLLQSNQPASQSAPAQSPAAPPSPVQDDLTALGQALSSGDLSSAQSDFAKLQKDLQPAGQNAGQSVGSARRHGHHHGPKPSDSDSDSTTTDTTASTASTASTSSQNPAAGSINVYA